MSRYVHRPNLSSLITHDDSSHSDEMRREKMHTVTSQVLLPAVHTHALRNVSNVSSPCFIYTKIDYPSYHCSFSRPNFPTARTRPFVSAEYTEYVFLHCPFIDFCSFIDK